MSIRVEQDGPVTMVFFDQGEVGDALGGHGEAGIFLVPNSVQGFLERLR